MQKIEETEEDIDYDFFVDEFVSALDSWYSADIKCCNNCYEDFIQNWPIALDRIPDSYSIDCLVFYKGSKLQNIYTEKQFLDNLYRVRCPRCGSSLESIFWAFEFDFDDFEDLEYDFYNLKESIKQTPFIVLKNELASKTYDLIEEISKQITPIKIDFPLYRGRIIKNAVLDKKDFFPPPPNYTNEGRYNHLGIPVIYAASTEATCFNELRRPTENLYIARFQVEKELKLLDLKNIDDENNSLLKAIILSSLASLKTDDDSKYKPEYYFTRFVADCCKYLNFDGIIYPSAQIDKGENYILFDTNILTEDKIEAMVKYN